MGNQFIYTIKQTYKMYIFANQFNFILMRTQLAYNVVSTSSNVHNVHLTLLIDVETTLRPDREDHQNFGADTPSSALDL